MALQTSGAISALNIRTEFSQTGAVPIGSYYRGGSIVPNITANNSVPTSGTVSYSNFYGARNYNVFATGGSVTTSGNFRIHTFTSSGTLSVSFGGSMEYLVVAGGGGGGYGVCDRGHGGGGGAGGVRSGTIPNVSTGGKPITIGAGGPFSFAEPLNDGSDSSALGITNTGGGGGGGWGVQARTGGSGGGGGNLSTSHGIRDGASGIAGQGNKGGDGRFYVNDYQFTAGGGGGAGAEGQNHSSFTGGNGGVGILSSISGASTYYGGGGGGAGTTRGVGGLGGGGNGAANPGTGDHGQANTGGGGGGSGDGDIQSGTRACGRVGGNGGSGIVIIRYVP